MCDSERGWRWGHVAVRAALGAQQGQAGPGASQHTAVSWGHCIGAQTHSRGLPHAWVTARLFSAAEIAGRGSSMSHSGCCPVGIGGGGSQQGQPSAQPLPQQGWEGRWYPGMLWYPRMLQAPLLPWQQLEGGSDASAVCPPLEAPSSGARSMPAATLWSQWGCVSTCMHGAHAQNTRCSWMHGCAHTCMQVQPAWVGIGTPLNVGTHGLVVEPHGVVWEPLRLSRSWVLTPRTPHPCGVPIFVQVGEV